MSFTGFTKTVLPGGSNILAYDTAFQRGIIKNYHLSGLNIRAQLQQMYGNGQRRLRIVIVHADTAGAGPVVLDSSAGKLTDQDKANLKALLSDLRDIGFHEVIASFHPGGGPGAFITNGPFTEEGYQPIWNFICDVRGVFQASGLAYRIDLLNEPSSDASVPYCQRLWSDALNTFVDGADPNLLGVHFSINTDWVHLVPLIYRPLNFDPVWPNVWALHLYDNALDVGTKTLAALPVERPVLVDETYWNDPESASDIAQLPCALLYTLQWMVTRLAKAGTVQNIIPIRRDVYSNAGL